MSRFFNVIKKNRFTFFMVVFLAVFYSMLFLVGHGTWEKGQTATMEKSVPIVSAKEIHEKEDLFKKNIQSHPSAIGGMVLFFLLVIVCGFYADTYLLKKKLKGEPLVAGGLPHGPVLWGVKDVGQVFVFILFAESLILSVEWILGHFVDLGGIEKHLMLMFNSLIRDMAAAGFVIFLVTRRFRHKLSEIGLTTRNFLKNVQIGVVGYLAAIPAILLVLLILSYTAQKFSYEPPVQPVVQIYLKEQGKNYLLFFTLFVALVGPLIEEIFFRGFTYRAFRQKFGVRWALVASSSIFAGLHMSLIAFFPIFLLGFFLAYLYENTGSLVPSMTVHMMHNLIMVLMTLVFKTFSV